MNKLNLKQIGSLTAKNGFKNEQDVIDIFNAWKTDTVAQEWLLAMNYKLEDIEYVEAVKIKGNYKADIQVQVKLIIKLKSAIDCQNIQVKLVSNKRGFNQIDKRWLKNYKELWNIPENIYQILQYYTGELKPYKTPVRDKEQRRMFMDEFTINEQNELLIFLNKNKTLIVSDILKGRGQFAAEWILVIVKSNNTIKWTLKPMNLALNYYSHGEITISKRGSIHIGRITMQRKGGDAGRETANMLQFKIDPTALFEC